MKIKPIKKSCSDVINMPKEPHEKPKKSRVLFRWLMKLVSLPDLYATKFTYEKVGMEKLKDDEPCLVLMNHSSFIDLEIVSYIFRKRRFNIVATTDCFAGAAWWTWLIKSLGCIPTKKFVADTTLVRDMMYVLKKTQKLGCNVP